jgi:hypothetical protein
MVAESTEDQILVLCIQVLVLTVLYLIKGVALVSSTIILYDMSLNTFS